MHPENGYGMLRQMILQQISDFLKKTGHRIHKSQGLRTFGWEGGANKHPRQVQERCFEECVINHWLMISEGFQVFQHDCRSNSKYIRI